MILGELFREFYLFLLEKLLLGVIVVSVLEDTGSISDGFELFNWVFNALGESFLTGFEYITIIDLFLEVCDIQFKVQDREHVLG